MWRESSDPEVKGTHRGPLFFSVAGPDRVLARLEFLRDSSAFDAEIAPAMVAGGTHVSHDVLSRSHCHAEYRRRGSTWVIARPNFCPFDISPFLLFWKSQFFFFFFVTRKKPSPCLARNVKDVRLLSPHFFFVSQFIYREGTWPFPFVSDYSR